MAVQENTTLKGEYADKVRADLADNSAEQERIRTELATLQEQLTTLEADHTLLASVSAALGDATATVPAPRRGRKPAATAPAKKAPTKKTPAKKGPTAAKPTVKKATAKQASPAKKTEAKKAPAKKSPAVKAPAVKASADKGPALTELIHAHLSAESEPRTAREIAKVLADSHPGRNVNDNLVRTTTERLVARSRVERVKQGSTVYYTAKADAPAAASEPAQKATAAAS